MRVLIVRPLQRGINDLRVDDLRVGHVYDLPPDLGSVLIVENYARLEMRSQRDRRRYLRGQDRRKG